MPLAKPRFPRFAGRWRTVEVGIFNFLPRQGSRKPVHIHHWHATILHLLGFGHEHLTFNYGGRDFRLTDVYGNVVKEILA